MIAGIDIETTGLVAGYNELVSLSVVLLEANFTIFDTFTIKSKPIFLNRITPESSSINGFYKDDYENDSDFLPAQSARSQFVTWAQNISDEKFKALAQDWTFDKNFLKYWLGDKKFDFLFERDYLDTKVISNFLMEADYMERGGTSLNDIANYFSIPEPKAHTSLGDVQTTIHIYKNQLELLKP